MYRKRGEKIDRRKTRYSLEIRFGGVNVSMKEGRKPSVSTGNNREGMAGRWRGGGGRDDIIEESNDWKESGQTG